MPVPSKTAKP
jgi:hypothetical protein